MHTTWRWTALTAVLYAAAVSKARAEPPLDTFVFIGERVSVERMADPCAVEPGEALRCITMDELFTARYRIVQPIVGTPAGDTLEFRVADHYGFPPFARFENALLFVAMAEPPYLHKYQAVPVHRTADGRWASCGDIRRNVDDPKSPEVRPLDFPDPIARWEDLAELGQQAYRSGEMTHWRVAGGEVRCTEGMYVEDVYRAVRDGVLRARGVSLPVWPAAAAAR
ncbi:hypothetical protein [Luteimonas terrae]|uniref:Uncharacterized protein n=1 Tax=Luteimonas terrae TaxID=1530191 RepID=A0A4R5UAE5_9GAMM|nr:hypothetical protein [Luteimonas terrae]TDK31556.1 hypothetical protein E2F49_08905 [Luteimonas terrae]